MRIYLYGPNTNSLEQAAIALSARSYWVRSIRNVMNPADPWNDGTAPHGAMVRHRVACELMDADLVVLHEDTRGAEAMHAISTCAFIGKRIVPYASLPLVWNDGLDAWADANNLASGAVRASKLIRTRWSATAHKLMHHTVPAIRSWCMRMERRMNAWLAPLTTNGNKQHRVHILQKQEEQHH